MDTKNQQDKSGNLKNVSKTGGKKVVEQVPDWLRMLLGKYGEAQGNLAGLEEPEDFEVEPAPAVAAFAPEPESEEEAQLSDLLEQMAEDGVPADAGGQSATSVEWGEPPAESAESSIDDLLSGMDIASPEFQEGGAQEDTAAEIDTGWLAGDDTAPAQDQPASPVSDDDVPDWLTDALESPTPVEEEPSPVATPAAAATTSFDSEIPDWLTDSQDDSPPADTPAAATTGEADEVSEIPDWLTDSVDAPATPGDSQEESVDAPDWINDVAPTAIQQETETPATADDSSGDFDVPDWLADMAPPTAAEPEAESQPAEPEGAQDIMDWEVPDWISEGDKAPSTETESADFGAPASDQETGSEPVPDWLETIQTTAAEDAQKADDAPDWLDNMQVEEAPPPGQSAAIEAPDWLQNIETESSDTIPEPEQAAPPPTPEAIEATPQTGTSADEDDWLDALSSATDEATPEQASQDQPIGNTAFLSSLDDMPSPFGETEEPSTQDKPVGDTDWLSSLDDSETSTDAAPDAEKDQPIGNTAFLSSLDDIQPPGTTEEEIVTQESDLPDDDDWVASLRGSNDEIETPDEAEGSIFDTQPDEETLEETAMPDWLSETPETSDVLETPIPLEAEEEPKSEAELPDWLTEDPQASADAPDWLADTLQTEESSQPAASDPGDSTPGLFSSRVLESLTDSTEEEEEPPSWLVDEGKDKAGDTDDWLADLPETEELPPLACR